MLSAIYYPHTNVQDENFLKHALLYWDEIECISPFDGFSVLGRYPTETSRTLGQFVRPHVPTKEEKHKAHQQIMELIEGDLPAWLKVDRSSDNEDRHTYAMFRDKLLPETWKELKKRGMVRFKKHGDLDDYVSHTYLGLTLMAILASCCAGKLKYTITDKKDAYDGFLARLESLGVDKWLKVFGRRKQQRKDAAREELITITLDVINAKALSVDQLVRLRSDKSALGSRLRTNYAEAVESYVEKLGDPDLSKTDAKSLRQEFKRRMKLDLAKLLEELGPIGVKTILSREVAVAVAAPIAGAAILKSTGIGAPLGAVLAAGALGKLRAEYRTARDGVFEKHSMAFLYAAKRIRLY